MDYKYLVRYRDSITRVIELVNDSGKSILIEFEAKDLADQRSFKTKLLNYGEYYFLGDGKEFNQLIASLEKQNPKQIEIIERLGFLPSKNKQADKISCDFVTSNIFYSIGTEVKRDRAHIFNLDGELKKLKIDEDIINLPFRVSKDLYLKTLKDFITIQAKSLNNNWDGLIALAWLRASLYASFLIQKFGSFPFLLVVGEKGSGKNFFCQTLLKVLGMEGLGDGIPSSTEVGILRKSTQMVDLPYWLDEYSKGQNSSGKVEGLLRSAYNRSNFVKADLNSSTEIKTTICTSTFLLSGESMSDDSATKDRFVNIILDRHKQNIIAKSELNDLQDTLSNIGGYWIKERTLEGLDVLQLEIKNELNLLTQANKNKDTRLLTSYAFISTFLVRILNEVDLDINIDKVLSDILNNESEIKQNGSHVITFWEDFVTNVRAGLLKPGESYYATTTKLGLHWPSVRAVIFKERVKQREPSRVEESSLKLYLKQDYEWTYDTFKPIDNKGFKGLSFDISKLPDFVQEELKPREVINY